MTIINNISTESLFVDRENAEIPYSTATVQLNQQLGMRRDTTPFSNIGSGKFRRIFDRHVTAYRR